MTLRDTLRSVVLGLPPADVQASLLRYATVSPQLASPFAPTPDQLQTIVFSDLLGTEYAPVTRAVAMGVPAIARARHRLCGTVARMPLVSLTRDTTDPVQPPWCQRTDGDLSPYHRMIWTVDDLLFYGWSLWAAQRGADTGAGTILAMARVPWDRWEIDGDGRILVDKQPVSSDQAVLIPGPHGGILNDGGIPIRMAADNLQAAANAARNPNPNVDLHYTGEEPLPDVEIDKLIQRWSVARRGTNGGVGFTSKWVEARTLGSHLDKLLIEGRNSDAVDMARLANVPAAAIDATSAGASLTYETTEGRNQELLDDGVQLYTDAISARLSMDDVVPRGRRTAFDTTELTTLTPNPTGAPTDD